MFLRGKIIYILWGGCGKKRSRKASWEEWHLSLLWSIGVGFWQVKMCDGKRTARAGAQSIWNEWLKGGLSYFLTSEVRKYLSQIAVRGTLSENNRGELSNGRIWTPGALLLGLDFFTPTSWLIIKEDVSFILTWLWKMWKKGNQEIWILNLFLLLTDGPKLGKSSLPLWLSFLIIKWRFWSSDFSEISSCFDIPK